MRHLLDTHLFIAILRNATDNLPDSIRRCMDGHDNYISAAMLREMAIKFRLGKLDFGDTLQNLPKGIERTGMTVLPVDARHAFSMSSPNLEPAIPSTGCSSPSAPSKT